MKTLQEIKEITELEARFLPEWEGQEYPSNYEILKVFPEARPYVLGRIKALKDRFLWLSSWVGLLFQEAYERFEGFNQWFLLSFHEILIGEDLLDNEKEINKLKLMLFSERIKAKSGVTDAMIQRAKAYDIKLILGVKKDMNPCVFHKEKHASAYLKKNYYHCFSCGETLDTIGLLMKLKNLKFPEAVKLLN